jgi:hypothetical protein
MTGPDAAGGAVTAHSDATWVEDNQRYLNAAMDVLRRRLRNEEVETALTTLVRAREELCSPPALEAIAAVFGLSEFERDVLLLCAGVQLDSDLARACAEAHGDPAHADATFSLAMSVLPDGHWSAITPEAPLRRWHLVELDRSDYLTTSPLHVDERVLHALTGISYLDPRLSTLARPVPAPRELTPALVQVAQRVVQQWSSPDGRQIVLHGARRSDARAAAAAAANMIGLRPVYLTAAGLPTDVGQGALFARLCERETALDARCWVVEVSGADGETSRAGLAFAARVQAPIAVLTPEPLVSDETDLVQVAVPVTPAGEVRSRWRSALGPSAVRLEDWVDRLSGQYRMGASEVDDVVESVAAVGGLDGEDVGPRLWEACRLRARPPLEQLAQRIEVRAGWSDLVLPDTQMRLLRQVVVHVRHRMTVFEDWQFGRHTSRGSGVAVLLAGPSGTGKTFASEVLAGELSLDLYRVDLSQVVSKYIGETEKNLCRIFDAAESGGAVLLFDEADALFGKRSEVKDSHDRYANIEVSYLLQRMETFGGLAILTTNLKSALDAAFLRRLRFVVSFPFPDAAARALIWRRMFPADVPTEDLDPGKLARLGVTGGTIRNIALSAAFLAADAGTPVQMSHLAKAAQTEYAKLERPLTGKELAGWT